MCTILFADYITEQFIEDEKKYWDYYKAYHNVFYEVLRHKKLDFTLLDLNRFPDMDYDIEKDHFNYRDYFKLSLAYQYLKVNSHEDYDSMKEEVKNIDSRILKFNLSSIWIDEIYKRNPHSEIYMKLLKRFSSTSFYYGSVKNLFNKRNRLEIGSPFPYPNTTDFYNKEIDLTKTKGRTVYMFLYAPEDAHLDHNFLNWNSFYLKHRVEDARFITIGLGTDRVRAVFQEVFIKSQIAGSHLSTSPKEARKLLKDLSIGYVPKVIKVDENGNIISFNVDANLQGFNPFENISLVKIWQKELAQRF